MLKCRCKKCNSISSDVPFEKRTVTIISNKSEIEERKMAIDHLKGKINVLPKCDNCGEELWLIFSI